MSRSHRQGSGLMSRSRSVPLRQYVASTAAANATHYNLEPYFTEVPDILEFGASWSEINDVKVQEGGSLMTSSMRRAGGGDVGIGGKTASSSSSSSAAAGGGGGRAAAVSGASRLSLMGPSGENAVGLGVCRRFMSITFFTQLNQVQIVTDDAKVPLTIRIFNRRGEPLQAWDFYVGAVIDILGRPTTLTSASASTYEWLDVNARRLWKSKCFLEERLNKFRSKPNFDLDSGVFRKLQHQATSLGGAIPLAQLANTVAKLENELRTYQ